MVRRLRAGGERIRTFSSAMPRHPPAAWPASFGGDWRRLEPPQELYRFYRGRHRSDDTAASRVARPQLRASFETNGLSRADLQVRIHSPPPASLLRTRFPGFGAALTPTIPAP